MGCSGSVHVHVVESAPKELKYSHTGIYPGGGPKRCHVPDRCRPWSTSFPYSPPEYTAPSVLKSPEWADNPAQLALLKFNEVDEGCKVDRRSFLGTYQVEANMPLNPVGRTGIRGRGLLGRFGPNHAADPIVTRWCRDPVTLEPLTYAGLPMLQFVAVRRRDTGDWAIPGGMVEPGESLSQTLQKEFGEEALNTKEKDARHVKQLEERVKAFFERQSVVVYRGYVDDQRNTDNAWIETVAMNFHDDDGTVLDSFQLEAGDDAQAVLWMSITPHLQLYANHRDFIDAVRRLHHAA